MVVARALGLLVVVTTVYVDAKVSRGSGVFGLVWFNSLEFILEYLNCHYALEPTPYVSI